jgi:hypothetical protein
MEELDRNFTSLVQSEALLSLTEPGKMNALKALVNKSIPIEQRKKDESSRTEKLETINQVWSPDEVSRWQLSFNGSCIYYYLFVHLPNPPPPPKKKKIPSPRPAKSPAWHAINHHPLEGCLCSVFTCYHLFHM